MPHCELKWEMSAKMSVKLYQERVSSINLGEMPAGLRFDGVVPTRAKTRETDNTCRKKGGKRKK